MTELETEAEAAKQPGLLLHGWKGVAQGAAMIAVAAGAGYAIYAERGTVRQGLAVLPHLRVGWLLAAIGAECLSMIAFGVLQRYMLRAGGARLSFGSVLLAAYRANATAVAVPVVGSGIATAQLFRDFRRAGAEAAQVSVALVVAGVVSSVAFAVTVTVGALVTGNPAAAGAAIAIAAAGVAVIAAVMLALRFPTARSRLVRVTTAVLGFTKKVARWPSGDPTELVENALGAIGGLRLGWGSGSIAFTAALVNWLTDVACLVCALKAAGGQVPWTAILIVWTAGAGAASFSPSPAGLGVVDIVLIAALSGAGIAVPIAVAAVVLYRIATFKIVITAICLAYPYIRRT
jgi:uncharacterized protein (TIRG00374 family)